MLETNLLLADAFVAYRAAWPYLDDKSAATWSQIKEAAEALDRASLQRFTPNAAYIQWKALRLCLSELRSMAIDLERLYVSKTYRVPRHQMHILLRRCNELLDRLANYGQE